MEFIGFAAAMASRADALRRKCKYFKWPQSGSSPVNDALYVQDSFRDNPDLVKEKYVQENFKGQFMEEVQRILSTMPGTQIKDEISITKSEINAAEFMLFVNNGEFIREEDEDKTNEFKFVEDNTVLEATIKYYEERKRLLLERLKRFSRKKEE
jgi:hypothetical protein